MADNIFNRRFPDQEFEDSEFDWEYQESPFWVEDQPGIAADDIILEFFNYIATLYITPAAINAICTKVDPTIPVIPLAITPAAIGAVGSRNNPSILVTPALIITPAALNAVSASINPSVIIPLLVSPAAINAVAGKLDPSIPILPDAIYAVANKFDPNVPINTIAATATAGRGNPSVTVTPPLIISFEMWAHSVTMVEGPFVFTNPEFITPQPISVITGKINPVVYILGGPEFVLPDPIYVIVGSIDPKVIRPFLEILELRSNIQTELEFMSMVKTELELDSLISTELELKSKMPYRQEETEEEPPIYPDGAMILDEGKLDEGKLG